MRIYPEIAPMSATARHPMLSRVSSNPVESNLEEIKKMSLKKFRNNQKGFTLVEVIVVAVIVAAMAAVAVPMYLSYVDSSRVNAASNTAGSLASFCGACRNSGGNVTVVTALAATGGGSLGCDVGTATIQVPSDIIVTHTAPTSSAAGIVTGKHKNSPSATAAASFNY